MSDAPEFQPLPVGWVAIIRWPEPTASLVPEDQHRYMLLHSPGMLFNEEFGIWEAAVFNEHGALEVYDSMRGVRFVGPGAAAGLVDKTFTGVTTSELRLLGVEV